MPPAGVTISTSADLKDIALGLHDKNSVWAPGSLRRVKACCRGWFSLGVTGQQRGGCEIGATCSRVAVKSHSLSSLINGLPWGDSQQSAASEQPPGCQWAALSLSRGDSWQGCALSALHMREKALSPKSSKTMALSEMCLAASVNGKLFPLWIKVVVMHVF